MSNDPRTTMVFILGGILCILTSIAAVAYLYHLHAAELADPKGDLRADLVPFLLFVGMPSLAGFVVGAILLAIGIKKDKSP
jgi:H+/Cl- antiporter ClcA